MGQYFDIFAKVGEFQYESFENLSGAKLMEHSYVGNRIAIALRNKLAHEWTGLRIYHLGDYSEDMAFPPDEDVIIVQADVSEDFRYVFNLDKKEYLDVSKTPFGEYGYRIDGTLMLTASGYDGGGGYYGKLNTELIGRWFGDRLESSNEIKCPDFKEIYPIFHESTYIVIPNEYNPFDFENYLSMATKVTESLEDDDLKYIKKNYLDKNLLYPDYEKIIKNEINKRKRNRKGLV